MITSTPGAGHIYPLVSIAKALADAGNDLLWATASDSCALVERHGFTATPAGVNASERMDEFLATTSDYLELTPRARRPVIFGGLFGRVAAPRMRDDLIGIFERFRPQLVVNDLAELGVAPVATARGVPHVTVAFSGLLPSLVLERAAAEVAGVWAAEGQTVPADLGLVDHLYLHPFPAGLGAAPQGQRVRSIRPLHFDGGPPDVGPDWISRVGIERPAVYVTFGTELGARAPWRAMLEPLGELDIDVIATTGPRFDQSTLSPTPPNVQLESYVPQHLFLDRVAIVVSHAGAGTMLAAAARGIPQLCIPIAADQFDNADALTSAGAGITLEPDNCDPSAVSGALARLLGEQAFPDAARALADQFEALAHPGALVPTIERLATA